MQRYISRPASPAYTPKPSMAELIPIPGKLYPVKRPYEKLLDFKNNFILANIILKDFFLILSY